MKLRHIIILVIFILVNILIINSLNFDAGKKNVEKNSKKDFYPSLSATVAKNELDTLKVVGYGTASSFNALDIASEVQGQLKKGKYDLKPGVNIRKGDLLFKIDDTEAQYNLRSRKSNFINILAALLPDIKIDFPDEFNKWEDYINNIRLNKDLPQLPNWNTNKEKIFLSTRSVLTEYFTIKSLETQTKKYAVYAPYNGVITAVYSTDFAVVSPGTPVIRVVETNNFEIPVAISVDQSDAIRIGTNVKIYSTDNEFKGVGHVVRISDVINKNTQSIEVYVRPKPIEGKMFTEGEYLKVEINEEEIHNGLRIPKKAIYENSVYLFQKNDSTLTRQSIKSFGSNELGTFVVGIPEHSIVITQEVLSYSDSTKYQIVLN